MENAVLKRNIRSLNLDDLKTFFSTHGEQTYRANQVYEWLWKKSAWTFDEMTSLSLESRKLLEENFTINHITVSNQQVSSDRTIKNAFRLFDGNIVEGVLIPTEKRMTACVSSQIGCSLSCKFCATGKLDRIRNLEADEIYDEVVVISKQAMEKYGKPLTNVVYMGMGEPLLNYSNVLASIEKITSPDGLGMASKRITVSTAGIAKMIRQLGDDMVKFNLALSLHAANDEKRSSIMPINESNTLGVLKEALQHYYYKTNNPVTFEYIIFKNFNDSIEDAAELAKFCSYVPSKVNIIEYNTIADSDFQKADEKRTDAFRNYLENKNIIAKVRRSRGKDIDAACGQLANKMGSEI
ncbi:MAG: 23S rRNA (adenine(2503)-C(2))-methyltransferase RlmN [Bacteroidia bacterium]|nr:23S rRNA (adenine(2503)-C(2))-methyltransferase RlmN [Bacteroidia bacterium]